MSLILVMRAGNMTSLELVQYRAARRPADCHASRIIVAFKRRRLSGSSDHPTRKRSIRYLI